MTPEQALSILDRVCANVHAPRQDHLAMNEAIGVMNDLIKECIEARAKKQNELLGKCREEEEPKE